MLKDMLSEEHGLVNDERNAETIQNLKNQIVNKTSGGGTLYLSEKNYYYCVPIELLDGDVTWYMLTILPSRVMEIREKPIQEILYFMIVIVLVLILIGVSLLILLSREQRTMFLRFAYEDPLTNGTNYAKFCIDLDACYIQLEVTESAMEGKSNIREMLEHFRSIGIQILMDDFGTGYSSLATLNMRCFDTLKLDKSLIDHIGDKSGETLLYYVINMGRQLGLHITAEGVENQVQFEYLQQLKCDDIQGFLFAKPMPSSQFEELL